MLLSDFIGTGHDQPKKIICEIVKFPEGGDDNNVVGGQWLAGEEILRVPML